MNESNCYLCDTPLARTYRVDPGDEFTYCPHCDRTKFCGPGCQKCRKMNPPPAAVMAVIR